MLRNKYTVGNHPIWPGALTGQDKRTMRMLRNQISKTAATGRTSNPAMLTPAMLAALWFEPSRNPPPFASSSATMRSPTKVEDRASIVGRCAAELVIRSSWPDRGPTAVSSPKFHHCLAMVSSHAGLRNQLWISRLKFLHNKNSIETRSICTRRDSTVVLSHQHANTKVVSKKLSQMPTDQRCTMRTKVP